MLKKIIFPLLIVYGALYGQTVAVIGCGYVGLTVAAVLCDNHHTVICFDIDGPRIDQLRTQTLPLYEPGLAELLFNTKNKISFTADFNDLLAADIFYICTPTPTDAHGVCDYSSVTKVFKTILSSIPDLEHKIVCIKSTVAPGTVRTLIKSLNASDIAVVYHPEFMREGSALTDVCSKNPLVFGSDRADAIDCIENLYAGFVEPQTPVIKTNYETAEMIKYAWNSFSAIRIGYVNELAYLCRSVGADITKIVQGIALSEQMLPTHMLKPGPGYGGSCLPKDTKAFHYTMCAHGFNSCLVTQAIQSNESQVERVISDIQSMLEAGAGTTVALLGLAFKANTNDIRHAPSVTIIKQLLEMGYDLKAYDPQAMAEMHRLYPQVSYCESAYHAVQNADCIVVLTEWDEIKKLDLEKVAACCRKKLLFDTRNIFDTRVLAQCGFTYLNMARRD